MTTKEKRQIIANKIKLLNELTFENYKYNNNPYYGGYAMYLIGKDGEHYTGWLGYNGRYKANEFIAYLDGLLNMYNKIQYEKS